jgi:hypothetical protein
MAPKSAVLHRPAAFRILKRPAAFRRPAAADKGAGKSTDESQDDELQTYLAWVRHGRHGRRPAGTSEYDVFMKEVRGSGKGAGSSTDNMQGSDAGKGTDKGSGSSEGTGKGTDKGSGSSDGAGKGTDKGSGKGAGKGTGSASGGFIVHVVDDDMGMHPPVSMHATGATLIGDIVIEFLAQRGPSCVCIHGGNRSVNFDLSSTLADVGVNGDMGDAILFANSSGLSAF